VTRVPLTRLGPTTSKSPAGSPRIDDPPVVAEVRTAFEQYEAALRAHDVAALNGFFWDSADAVRYGPGESGYGARSIRSQRRRAEPVPAGRRLRRTVISTFGTDAATVSTEFTSKGTSRVGRQTQAWIRIDGAWRIVAAHVSVVDPVPLARRTHRR
jgi:ketosteroid isomerase-like protein